ncbi:MAG: hypothetical protein GF411_13960 [Candidatus Lokiarchaeota archaeon]|nr:hypothetical protein [Candidatus Lokiarchaeota archaeon]
MDNERDEQDVEVNEEKQNETDADEALIDELLAFREILLGKHDDIRCLVFAALRKDSSTPAVVFHGQEVDHTALAVSVATELRNRVMKKISGNW